MLLGSSIAVGMTAAAQKVEKEDMKTITVESLKDGMILDLQVKDGETVKPGTIICHFLPDDEQRSLERLQLASAIYELQAKMLDDVRARRLRKLGTFGFGRYGERPSLFGRSERTRCSRN